MFARRRRGSKVTNRIVDYSSRDSPYRLDEKPREEYSPDIAYTLRSLKAKIRSCKADNDRIIQSQERLAKAQAKRTEVNAVIL